MAGNKNNNKNVKYIVMIIVFTFLFFILMAICFIGFAYVSMQNNFQSLDGRREALELSVKMGGPERIMDELYFDRDYEEDFDSYWDFAIIRREYIKGRFSDDKTESINIINDFINNTKNDSYKKEASKYIEMLQK